MALASKLAVRRVSGAKPALDNMWSGANINVDIVPANLLTGKVRLIKESRCWGSLSWATDKLPAQSIIAGPYASWRHEATAPLAFVGQHTSGFTWPHDEVFADPSAPKEAVLTTG